MSLFEFWSRLPEGETVHPDDRAVLEGGPHGFHFDLPPAAVLGPLRTAPVILCYGNPGHEQHNAELVREPSRNAQLARQIEGVDPYPVWMPGWGEALAARCRQMGLGARGAREHRGNLQCRAVCLGAPRCGRDCDRARLPSAAVARAYLHEVLVPRARKEEIFLVVVRSHVLWGAVELEDSRTCKFSRRLAVEGKLGVLGAEIRGWLDRRVVAGHPWRQ